MSTITKLDPMVRVQRTQRKNAIRQFVRLVTQSPSLHVEAAVLLVKLRKDPRFDGYNKHAKATKILSKITIETRAA